jgi:hypothetical protein
MSKITELASAHLTAIDTITIELVEANERLLEEYSKVFLEEHFQSLLETHERRKGRTRKSSGRKGALHNAGCSRGLKPPVSSRHLAM